MRYQVCVSGSASGESVRKSKKAAYDMGKALAEKGQNLMTGATVGLPHFAAQGFVSVKPREGSAIGFSPATSTREHLTTYRLPIAEFDSIIYTGMAYVGRDIHLVRSSDALILIGGRLGSLHELATALDGRRVCGVLLGSGGLADYVPTLLENIEAPGAKEIIFESDPYVLVEKVVAELERRNADLAETSVDASVS